jgi:hypothetical protein
MVTILDFSVETKLIENIKKWALAILDLFDFPKQQSFFEKFQGRIQHFPMCPKSFIMNLSCRQN